MKQTTLKSGEISIWTVILISLIMIGISALLVLPSILPHDHSNGKRIRALINVKQIATGTIIYQADYDDLYPPASGMPAVRVVLEPYTKNHDLFKPVEDISTTPQFNFNLAGVDGALLPAYHGSKAQNVNEIAMWSSYLTGKNPEWIIAFADSGTKRIKLKDFDKVAQAFQGQFDRKGVKLWPADYLQPQDPLK
ncbi:MAG: type II secretion system protein [Fimbriimonadaceae bacterium]|nr:type II secretion system protein [Fimbriimonadaceae bacterium]